MPATKSNPNTLIARITLVIKLENFSRFGDSQASEEKMTLFDRFCETANQFGLVAVIVYPL